MKYASLAYGNGCPCLVLGLSL